MRFSIRTSQKEECIDLTPYAEQAVRESGVQRGVCHVYAPHATAAVIINENADPNVLLDLLDALRSIIPDAGWRHDAIDKNGAAHLKAALLGPGVTVPVRNGRLALGTWQALILVELDGPRERNIIVTVINE